MTTASFRERYGAEIRGLVEDTDIRLRTVLDLIGGAARAWSGPSFQPKGPNAFAVACRRRSPPPGSVGALDSW
ncbi:MULTISPECIES: hypothetical protein [unclassified Frankia]|uniref:hypothetical protein n=1 Tax=unclassified Frankia TaxID=2632575 RepID=UPI001EE4E7A0|nr:MULTISPECIES: hypothetical protein [unclassified Frankia]